MEDLRTGPGDGAHGTGPRAVVLSGSLGLGHEMLVRSCAAALEQSGWRVRSLDCMALLGRRSGPASERTFNHVVGAIPAFYDGLHFAHLRTGSRLATFMDDRACGRLVPALRADLAARPADLVLSVFATGASAAARLKAETPGRRTVVLCTDVTLHRLWVSAGTDLFLATSPAAEASVRRYLPRARVSQLPPPVRAAFYHAPAKAKARAALGIPHDRPCLLVIDSGWGFGPTERSVDALAEADVEVLAVAGRQVAVEARLRALAQRRSRVHPFGFVDDVPVLMAAADAVVALPGATTCAEARVVGRPLLLLDLMPGHGRENVLHELELGGARVCGPTHEDVVEAALALLDELPRMPRPKPTPRWEPAFAAALRGIGLDVQATAPSGALPALPQAASPPVAPATRDGHRPGSLPSPTSGRLAGARRR